MQSKFNILILEDDQSQKEELEQTFVEKLGVNYKIYVSSNIEEFVLELSRRFYLGMSLDHKVPLSKQNSIAKKYDIDVINKLYKYHPLGYKSIYTAFPKWDSAKTFGAKIDYVSKKDTSTNKWAIEFLETLTEYKKMESDKSIYTKAEEVLFFPFSALINAITNDFNNVIMYQNLFNFSIEMFYIITLAMLDKKEKLYANSLEEKMFFIKKNLEEIEHSPRTCSQELLKTLDRDFLMDMQFLEKMLYSKKFNSVENTFQDLMALLLLKLNFFSSNSFAIKVKTRRNYLRQVEVEAVKIESRAFKTKEYITDFYELPQNISSIYLIFKDYYGKSYFLDMGEYLDIKMEEMGNIKVISKLSEKQIFPMEGE